MDKYGVLPYSRRNTHLTNWQVRYLTQDERPNKWTGTVPYSLRNNIWTGTVPYSRRNNKCTGTDKVPYSRRKILKFIYADGSRNLFDPGSGIQDGKNSYPRSEINIPDPQHWVYLCSSWRWAGPGCPPPHCRRKRCRGTRPATALSSWDQFNPVHYIDLFRRRLTVNNALACKTSVGDPWHFGTDPDPGMHTSD